jgi:hypothetical protein
MISDDYFRGVSGTRYTYADIAARIRSEALHTLGKHISVQLEAIGLLEEMRNGTTPCGLPFTFAEAECSPSAPTADALPSPFDDYEIEPRIKHWEDGDPEKPDHIHCDEHEADMWRLYGTVRGRDSVCIGEYARRALAEEVYAGITGRHYAEQTGADPAKKPYSVLLLYPADANDGGAETYYAFVEAPDPSEAVALARRQAVAANECLPFEPDEFASLLVTEGHHADQPLFNK